MTKAALTLVAAVLLGGQAQAVPTTGLTIIPAPRFDVPVSVSDAEARLETRRVTLRKIILVGDSTVQVGTGWGGAFCAMHVAAVTPCIDMALGGRSTLNYRAEGSWGIALNEARAPGFSRVYMLIQFGHNDQPGKPGQSTDLETEFPQNLKRYVLDARRAGAVPVLVTPLTRRDFVAGSLQDSLAPWADKVIEVARMLNVPVVDLHKMSVDLVQALGPLASLDLSVNQPPKSVVEAAKRVTSIGAFKPGIRQPGKTGVAARKALASVTFDYTHLGPQGTGTFAQQVAKALVVAVPDLRGQVKP
ncbi:MAG: rhamnogalacturonan acetylesterase [Sphingomicrobium sp.]